MASQVSLATAARMALTSIDSAFLGHLGTKELAASALANVWTSLPLLTVWAGSSSLITLCGQAWGAKNPELTGVWLQFGLIVTMLLGIPVFIWYWLLEFPMRVSTDDEKIIELSVTFARALSFSIFPSLCYACMRQYFQAMGIMWPTTIVGITSIAVTILANYVLIYGMGGWSGLGFVGSPLATVVASWFQPLLLFSICVLWKKYHKNAWFGWKREALSVERLKIFCKIALPIAGNSFVANLAQSLVTLVAARMGAEVVAANAVIQGLWSMLWAFFWGYGCSTQVRVANFMGEGKPKSAKALAFLGLICTLVTVAFLTIACATFSRKLFGLYSSDPKMLDLCESALYLFIGGFALESIEMLITGVLTGMGKVKPVFFISLIGTWCINLPLCYILGLRYNYGLKALWLAVCCMEAFKLTSFTILLALTDFKKEAKRAHAQMAEKNNEDAQEVVSETSNLLQNEDQSSTVPINMNVEEDDEFTLSASQNQSIASAMACSPNITSLYSVSVPRDPI